MKNQTIKDAIIKIVTFSESLKDIFTYFVFTNNEKERKNTKMYDLSKIIQRDYFFERIKTLFDQAGEDKQASKPGYYPSIRYWGIQDLFNFWNKNILSNGARNQSFLDIGSCNGEKLFLAKCAGFKTVRGIEISETSNKISRKMLSYDPSIKIIQGDAFDLPKIIASTDLVYTYHPIEDYELYLKLVLHILTNLKISGKWMEVLTNTFTRILTNNDYSQDYYSDILLLKKEKGRFVIYLYSIEVDYDNKSRKIKKRVVLNYSHEDLYNLINKMIKFYQKEKKTRNKENNS